MDADLPSRLLRSLVALAEAGSLARAAQRLGRSESALSLQMKTLETLAGLPLFSRDGRALTLTQAGSLLLGHARIILARIDAARADLAAATGTGPLRLGLVQDFSGTLLTGLLRRLRQEYPAAPVSVQIAGSHDLLKALGEDRIDLALAATGPAAPAPVVRLPMDWFGDIACLGAAVVPLAMIAPPCPFLETATAALDRHGTPWRLAMLTPGLDGVRAALAAGLGIACRTGISLPGLPRLADARLPSLPSIGYSLYLRPQASGQQKRVADLLCADLASLVSAAYEEGETEQPAGQAEDDKRIAGQHP
jgi:DNA-binding transcriptional LysR family regulator